MKAKIWMALALLVAAGPAFAEDEQVRRLRVCANDMSASQVASQQNIAAAKAYRSSGSDSDYCAMMDTSKALYSAAEKAIRSCEKELPEKMAAERASLASLKTLHREQQAAYAKRCRVGKALQEAAIGACSDASNTISNRQRMDKIVDASYHLSKVQPNTETCSHYRVMEAWLADLPKVLKTCRGVPRELFDPEAPQQMAQKVRASLSKHRAAHPRLCTGT